MKRDFLKELGIEDKELINKILDENSADIGRAKGEVEELKSKITQLETQLSDKTNEYTTLAERTKDFDVLTEKVTQLESEKATLTSEKDQLKTDLDNQMNNLRLDFDIEVGLRDAGAKNVKAAKALLDMGKITRVDNKLQGFDEQIEALKNAEDSAFIFGTKSSAPSGTQFYNPNNKGGNPPPAKNFADAVANALSKNK